jgi:hypothetical protein
MGGVRSGLEQLGKPMEELNIFISSPGDVKEERQEVRQLITRITERSNNRIKLNAYTWENDQLFLATEGGYQTNIIRSADPADFDLLLLIIWSRLGTPLNPADFDDAQYRSGTEYEYLRATRAYKERKERGEIPLKPDILIFRRADKILPPPLDLNDPASLERAQEFNRQAHAVVAFFRTHIERDYNTAAYHSYSISKESGSQSQEDSFSEKVEHCLIEWIKSKLRERGEDPEVAMRLKSWHKSPFRALEVFEERHEAIYFGRDHAKHQVLDQFKSQCESASPFVLIYGASGSGKSSLLRAGVIPKFRGGGVVDGVGGWNISLLVPSKAVVREGDDQKPDLIRALAESLASAVPDLRQTTTIERFANALRNGPLESAVGDLASALEAQRFAERERRNGAVVDQIRVLIALDQIEELFTMPGLGDVEVNAFFSALSHLSRSVLVGIIGTMRSDFYDRCDKVPALAALTAKAGS